MKPWMFPFKRSGAAKSAIAALSPLVFYAQKDMSRKYWRNSGSLGSEYDLDAVWGHVDGGSIVQNSVVGNLYQTNNGVGNPSGLYTSSYSSVISPESAVCFVHFNIGVTGTRFLWAGRILASPYGYVDNTPRYALNSVATMFNNTTQQSNIEPQWVINKLDGASSKMKSRYGVQTAGSIGNYNISGVTLGATAAFAGVSITSAFATFFIVKGKSIQEIEGAVLADFPGLI